MNLAEIRVPETARARLIGNFGLLVVRAVAARISQIIATRCQPVLEQIELLAGFAFGQRATANELDDGGEAALLFIGNNVGAALVPAAADIHISRER